MGDRDDDGGSAPPRGRAAAGCPHPRAELSGALRGRAGAGDSCERASAASGEGEPAGCSHGYWPRERAAGEEEEEGRPQYDDEAALAHEEIEEGCEGEARCDTAAERGCCC